MALMTARHGIALWVLAAGALLGPLPALRANGFEGAPVAQQPRTVELATITKTVQSNGLSFPVVDVGRGAPVLLLHGFPDDRHLWRYQIPALADAGFRVIVPDLRGFGEAPRPTDPKDYEIGRASCRERV